MVHSLVTSDKINRSRHIVDRQRLQFPPPTVVLRSEPISTQSMDDGTRQSSTGLALQVENELMRRYPGYNSIRRSILDDESVMKILRLWYQGSIHSGMTLNQLYEDLPVKVQQQKEDLLIAAGVIEKVPHIDNPKEKVVLIDEKAAEWLTQSFGMLENSGVEGGGFPRFPASPELRWRFAFLGALLRQAQNSAPRPYEHDLILKNFKNHRLDTYVWGNLLDARLYSELKALDPEVEPCIDILSFGRTSEEEVKARKNEVAEESLASAGTDFLEVLGYDESEGHDDPRLKRPTEYRRFVEFKIFVEIELDSSNEKVFRPLPLRLENALKDYMRLIRSEKEVKSAQLRIPDYGDHPRMVTGTTEITEAEQGSGSNSSKILRGALLYQCEKQDGDGSE